MAEIGSAIKWELKHSLSFGFLMYLTKPWPLIARLIAGITSHVQCSASTPIFRKERNRLKVSIFEKKKYN